MKTTGANENREAVPELALHRFVGRFRAYVARLLVRDDELRANGWVQGGFDAMGECEECDRPVHGKRGWFALSCSESDEWRCLCRKCAVWEIVDNAKSGAFLEREFRAGGYRDAQRQRSPAAGGDGMKMKARRSGCRRATLC